MRMTLTTARVPQEARRHHHPVLLQDETSSDGVTRFLRPGRRFQVNDPGAFNQSFRGCSLNTRTGRGAVATRPRLRSRKSSTRSASKGRGVGASPHAIRQGDIRGPRDTDPRESSGDRKRDGLYYRAYVHNPERARKEINAKRLFHEPALPARVSGPPSAPAGDREHPGPLVEDTRAAKRARSSAVPLPRERGHDVAGEAAMEASLYSSTSITPGLAQAAVTEHVVHPAPPEMLPGEAPPPTNEVPSPPSSGPYQFLRASPGQGPSFDGDVSDVDAETSSPESFSENGAHMDPPVLPQDDLVQVDSFFADENHTDSSMPFPPSDDSFADDSFPHDETQTGETMRTEDGKGMDLDTALEAVCCRGPRRHFHVHGNPSSARLAPVSTSLWHLQMSVRHRRASLMSKGFVPRL